MAQNKRTTARKIKALRQKTGLNRADFAQEFLGLSKDQYSLIEDGKISPSKNVLFKLGVA